jgi:membrane-bound lytic murein transglycosylase D
MIYLAMKSPTRNKYKIVLILAALFLLSGCSTLSSIVLFGPEDSNPTPPVLVSKVPVLKTTESQKTTIAAKRASKLPAVELTMNRAVQKELDNLKSQPRTVERALVGRDEHANQIEQIFKDEGVPADLVNVAFVESGFNEKAKSPAGAVGLWQLMKSTAQYYGLKVNHSEDQRKDVVLSSLAAARHLRDLYNNYDDWHLALAAYNFGVGGIERAMARGNTRDFWELVQKGLVPKETARFVPKILAAAIIMKNPEEHGFDSVNIG